MVINTNIAADRSARLLAESSEKLSKSLARLSSGSRIVSPEDDAAGLAVSMRLDARSSRLGAALNNVSAATAFSQTQEGFLAKVSKALDRMSELSIRARDVTVTDSDRALYDLEFQQLGDYITDIAGKDFNGVDLLDGTVLNVTIDSEGATFAMNAPNLGGVVYTTATGSSVDTAANAATALTNVQAAIVQLSGDRALVGANLARLNYTSEQLSVLKESINSANSRIRDVDVAQEATQYARYSILVQSGTAMVAQANAVPQSVLKLLQ
jgi:flagellin